MQHRKCHQLGKKIQLKTMLSLHLHLSTNSNVLCSFSTHDSFFIFFLLKRLLQAYAEEHAIQDLLYYLAEGLRRESIGLDTYLKVRYLCLYLVIRMIYLFVFSMLENFLENNSFCEQLCIGVDKLLLHLYNRTFFCNL